MDRSLFAALVASAFVACPDEPSTAPGTLVEWSPTGLSVTDLQLRAAPSETASQTHLFEVAPPDIDPILLRIDVTAGRRGTTSSTTIAFVEGPTSVRIESESNVPGRFTASCEDTLRVPIPEAGGYGETVEVWAECLLERRWGDNRWLALVEVRSTTVEVRAPDTEISPRD